MMLWLRVSVIFKNKAALHTQKGANFGLKCVRMRLAAGLRPDPLGERERSPRPPSRNWGGVPTSKGDGKGMGKGKEGDGKGRRGGEGGKERRGREGEGRLASHTFLGPAYNRTKNDKSILYTTGVMENFLLKF